MRAPLLLVAALALAASPAAGASPRHPPRLLGGLEEADAQEEGVRRALDFAMSEYNKGSNDAYHSRAVQVVRARKQIVSGVNYYIDVEIGRTTCTKSQANLPDLADCPFHDQPHLMKVGNKEGMKEEWTRQKQKEDFRARPAGAEVLPETSYVCAESRLHLGTSPFGAQVKAFGALIPADTTEPPPSLSFGSSGGFSSNFLH